MNIKDLVYDVIVEEVKNKKLFNFLLKKWYGDNPTPEQIQKAENDLTLFSEKQKSLTPKNPAVYSFLLRHDGNHGVPAFDPQKIMDISQYSIEEINSLLHEFRDATLTAGEEDEFKGKLTTDDKKVAASKKLWLSDRDILVDEENFKVHLVTDARESIKYGFYQQNIAEKLGGLQWCVTGRNTSDSRSNLWGSYRPRRTFYFVIDETKNPKDNPDRDINKYYLSALQYCERDHGYTGFKITSLYNDGDTPKTWEEVVSIYPQLADKRDIFTYIQYDETELFDRSLMGRINEIPGNKNEFARQMRELKKAYLDGGGVVTTSSSWKSMDTNLRNIYILTLTSRDVYDKFQTYELMSEIKKVGNEYKLLDNTIKTVGSRSSNESMATLGVGYIYQHLMENEFIIGRSSIDAPQITLFKSKKTKKFGLYDLRKTDWVKHDGIYFEPDYGEDSTVLYIDDQGNQYIVETYVTSSGNVDNSSLYVIYPVNEENDMAGAHFVGAKQFEQLSVKFHPKDENDDPDMVRIKDINPETDVDIKE